MNEIDLSGFSFLEKFKFKIKKKKLNFRELKVLSKKNVVIKTNTIFLGKHKGEIKIEPNCYFIHRGELQGKLYISEKSKVYIFGKVNGVIISEDLINLRAGCDVSGKIKCKSLRVEPGVKMNTSE